VLASLNHAASCSKPGVNNKTQQVRNSRLTALVGPHMLPIRRGEPLSWKE
jgi:hypothetical protein